MSLPNCWQCLLGCCIVTFLVVKKPNLGYIATSPPSIIHCMSCMRGGGGGLEEEEGRSRRGGGGGGGGGGEGEEEGKERRGRRGGGEE